MKKDFWKIGLSSAASWAWGTSLIMGQQIAQEKGLIAWLIWAVCNTLTLALFGWLFSKRIIDPKIYRKKEVKVIALIIQLFCLLIQLNFINQQFLLLTNHIIGSYLITTIIGLIFILIVFRKGLPTSIMTDVYQWLIAIISIIVIILIAIITDAPLQVFPDTSIDSVLWGLWSSLILFAGPIGDMQHWQRAEADISKKAYYLGAISFGLYMILILAMALFQFNTLMNIILLVAVLCITTSTIDSIGVALHELGNRYIGTSLAISLCAGFGIFINMGIVELWSSFGVIRFTFAIAILLLPFCLAGKLKISISVILLTFTTMSTFSFTGDIVITSNVGAFSFGIATLILFYLIYKLIKNSHKEGINYEIRKY